MITTLARGEMNTIILPVQAVVMGCMLFAFLGGIPLISSAYIMRDSRDRDTQQHARTMLFAGMAMLVVPLIAVIACTFIYQSQGGFE